ncbi:MAG: IS110 family transposase [Firmicutes bacterium]|nr:IS110 family transposase [Bacillota bacterium]
MITLGVDAHKEVHMAVALDENGRELSQWRGPNTQRGWEQVYRWACKLGEARQWGIEGAWGYGRRLAQYLVGRGDVVYEINSRWTAMSRRKARKLGKTDKLDARAVAVCVMRETGTLPQISQEDITTVLNLLSIEREAALAEATRLRNQIHAVLPQIDPEYRLHLPNMQTQAGLLALERYDSPDSNSIACHRAATIRRLARRLRLVLEQSEDIAHEIEQLASTYFLPLTRLCGINLLTAGALAGILGPGRRFASDAQLAAYAGVAPIEASSAGLVRHRLHRGGNRRLNAILYRIAITQARHLPEARCYLLRRTSEGKTRREAFRALKRYIVRAIWQLWQECLDYQTHSLTDNRAA